VVSRTTHDRDVDLGDHGGHDGTRGGQVAGGKPLGQWQKACCSAAGRDPVEQQRLDAQQEMMSNMRKELTDNVNRMVV
jgi:hypothetical protein